MLDLRRDNSILISYTGCFLPSFLNFPGSLINQGASPFLPQADCSFTVFHLLGGIFTGSRVAGPGAGPCGLLGTSSTEETVTVCRERLCVPGTGPIFDGHWLTHRNPWGGCEYPHFTNEALGHRLWVALSGPHGYQSPSGRLQSEVLILNEHPPWEFSQLPNYKLDTFHSLFKIQMCDNTMGW